MDLRTLDNGQCLTGGGNFYVLLEYTELLEVWMLHIKLIHGYSKGRTHSDFVVWGVWEQVYFYGE